MIFPSQTGLYSLSRTWQFWAGEPLDRWPPCSCEVLDTRPQIPQSRLDSPGCTERPVLEVYTIEERLEQISQVREVEKGAFCLRLSRGRPLRAESKVNIDEVL